MVSTRFLSRKDQRKSSKTDGLDFLGAGLVGAAGALVVDATSVLAIEESETDETLSCNGDPLEL